MDEDIAIIDSKTRNEKIKSFFINNKKLLISLFTVLILSIFGFYFFQSYKESQKEKLSDKYNISVTEYNNEKKTDTISSMKEIINYKDSTYSPLALYFLIDNNLIDNKKYLNILFDELIDKTNFDNEIKNLIIYKKALFNAEFESENNLLNILQPLINSNSIWESHALYLLAEYFYSNNEKQKAKEFFNKILILENSNSDIKTETQKRLNRDFGE